MLKIAVSADTETWGSSGRVVNVTAFVDPTDGRYHHYGDSVVKEMDVQVGDTVYAVVGDYSTASTRQQRTGGHATVLDVFTSLNDAMDLAKAHQAEPGPEDSSYSFTHNGVEYFRVGSDYFDELNELVVWGMIVKVSRPDPFRKKPDSGEIDFRWGY